MCEVCGGGCVEGGDKDNQWEHMHVETMNQKVQMKDSSFIYHYLCSYLFLTLASRNVRAPFCFLW